MLNLAAANRGFSLIELVIVIVILGIVSLTVGNIVSSGTKIYVDATERDQLLSESRFVVERLNRELRMAVPNSARVIQSVSDPDNKIQCLEFVPTQWVTFYTQLPVLPSSTTTVNVVEIADSGAKFSLQSGDFAVVYPTSNADVYDLSNNKRRAITACTDAGDGDCSTADAANHLAQLTVTAAFADDSPASRLYIVRQAVSYCARDGGIYRHVSVDSDGNNTINATQTLYNDVGILMAENLVNDLSSDLPFRVYEAALNRNGLVQVLLAFEHNDEIINYSNEVHIPNVP
jgi:MSHA biogenesis protein MshO